MNGSPREQGLWFAYRMNPTDQTRNRLVEHYLPFVRSLSQRIAARIPDNLVDSDDLYQIGAFTVLRRIPEFDAGRGLKFTTFVGARIRGAILDHLRTLDYMSRTDRPRANAVKRALADFENDYTAAAAATGIDESECRSLTRSHGEFLADAAGSTVLALSR